MDTEIIEQLETTQNAVINFFINYGFQFIGAIIILLLGWQVSRWVSRLVLKLCDRAKLDVTLSRFFTNVTKTLVLIFVIIIALGKFGITIAPFIAALGAIAFGSTLALQGPLSNYGAGLTIILTRPFVVGDTIKIQGVSGVVDEIKLAYTYLTNEDNEKITIPNKQIVGEILHNTFSNLLVETVIRVGYGDEPDRVIGIIRNVLSEHEEVANDPPPVVGIHDFGEYAVEIGMRYWLPTKRYYELLYGINQEISNKLRENNITIALPQHDIHIKNGPG